MKNKSLNILAFDTSTEACTIALQTNQETCFFHDKTPNAHTQILLPKIQELLRSVDITLQELDCIAFGQGPGSFTGVRIAASAAQGLAFGLQIPVIGISTLQTIAQGAYRINTLPKICATIDARMHEFYWGLYAVNQANICQLVGEEQVSPYETIKQMLSDYVLIENILPHAEDMLLLAQDKIKNKNFDVTPLAAQPVYIRNKVTE